MANVLHRITKAYRRSVDTPEFNPAEWIIKPDLSAVAGVHKKYWKIDGDTISEMNQAEKDAVDNAIAAVLVDREMVQMDVGVLRRFALILIDEINALRMNANIGF